MKNPIPLVAEKWRGWSKVQRGVVVVLGVGLCLVVLGKPAGRRLPSRIAPAKIRGPESSMLDAMLAPFENPHATSRDGSIAYRSHAIVTHSASARVRARR